MYVYIHISFLLLLLVLDHSFFLQHNAPHTCCNLPTSHPPAQLYHNSWRSSASISECSGAVRQNTCPVADDSSRLAVWVKCWWSATSSKAQLFETETWVYLVWVCLTIGPQFQLFVNYHHFSILSPFQFASGEYPAFQTRWSKEKWRLYLETCGNSVFNRGLNKFEEGYGYAKWMVFEPLPPARWIWDIPLRLDSPAGNSTSGPAGSVHQKTLALKRWEPNSIHILYSKKQPQPIQLISPVVSREISPVMEW